MKSLIKNFKDMDKVLLVVSIILFVFGLFNIVTASSQVSVLKYNQSLYNYFYRQLAMLVAGTIATFIILKRPTSSYYFWGKIGYFIVGGLLIYVTFFGENFSGNQNWIKIFGVTLQPSEFSKPMMIVYLSLLFERFYKKLNTKDINHWDMIGKILIIGLLFPVIIFTQKDLGTTIIVFAIFGLMFLASPILKHEKFQAIFVAMVVAILGLIIILFNAGSLISDTQKSRFDFYDPCSKYEDGGYQICNGFIAINSGGLIGVGIGNSRQKSYIPESHTDSVFAIIAEEYGFVVSSIIFGLFVIVLYRILRLASLTSSIRGRYMALGVACYIFLHILVNLGGLFGSMPLTGVPLPFLSYGGSFCLSLCVALAIVQRVHIEYKNEKIRL